MRSTHITYLFDPLCGWCYGAAVALKQLSAVPGVTLALAPSGLFAGPGARPMDAALAAYAWSNDERIERLTGQRFTALYRQQILQAPTRFDSGPATLALTAVARCAPQQELAALSAIQTARYVDGRDTAAADVLADILQGQGLQAAATEFLQASPVLVQACTQRLQAAHALMHRHGVQGVPALVLRDTQGERLLRGNLLYGDTRSLLQQVQG